MLFPIAISSIWTLVETFLLTEMRSNVWTQGSLDWIKRPTFDSNVARLRSFPGLLYSNVWVTLNRIRRHILSNSLNPFDIEPHRLIQRCAEQAWLTVLVIRGFVMCSNRGQETVCPDSDSSGPFLKFENTVATYFGRGVGHTSPYSSIILSPFIRHRIGPNLCILRNVIK